MKATHNGYWRSLLALLCLFAAALPAAADRMDSYQIGGHGQANISYPAWFKQSFLDLREDLEDARNAGKRGIIVFFSQKNCNHCQAFLDTTLGDPGILRRVRDGYDVIGLDIFNDVEVTDPSGRSAPVRAYAETEKARFTPTLVFYAADGARLLSIVGFYPPQKFSHVLDFIEGGHYKNASLSDYLRSTPVSGKGVASLAVDYSIFAKPPHDLARRGGARSRGLVVVFDQAGCAACERFRDRVLADGEVRSLLARFDAVQLDRNDLATVLVDPAGRRVTARTWADELALTYEPSVVFFDEDGREVHRIDSECGKDRMAGSLQYVLEKAYIEHPQFLRWRREKAREASVNGRR
jgi:thioredoxin-related protein